MAAATRWGVGNAETVLTLEEARDLMLECFIDAQSQALAKSGFEVGLDLPATGLRERSRRLVEEVFASLGEDYLSPTRDGLIGAAVRLCEQARECGLPSDVVEQHWNEYSRILVAI